MSIATEVPTVNYHLWRPCNMRCGFCFATFQDISPDILPKGHLGRDGCVSVVESLAHAGFAKINFAGGEPTLCTWLPELIRLAKERGLTTSIVTNGSRITTEWLESLNGSLDWAALSIDSIDPDTLVRTGRTTRAGPMSREDYLRAVRIFKQHDVRVKINTVVTRDTLKENLADFVEEARPERWKLLQVLPVKGQNDRLVDEHVVSPAEFDRYVRLNRRVEGARDHAGAGEQRPYEGQLRDGRPRRQVLRQRSRGLYVQRPIIEVGVEQALKDVSIDVEKFLSRNGLYNW